MAVGAGGAFTPGVNLLPSVGLSDFSVGVTETELELGVVVGASFSLLVHPAITVASRTPPHIPAHTLAVIRFMCAH